MNLSLIIEIALKVILAMLCLGFIGCFALFAGVGISQFRENRKLKKDGWKPDHFTLFSVLICIFSVLMAVLFGWLIMIGWWAA